MADVISPPEAPAAVRDRLVLALDVDDLDTAIALARRLTPWFGTAKVGFELFTAAGPDAFARLHDLGMRVFADLKFHDIPTTVERAARAAARHGVEFLNLHS
ncbi:MAG: orotidine 5'-phosphate decarboxylase, partial [Actinobacteria bacterium]|nr:orotidine 5'-phosphate decarboxylase [Actinomycetota bacterium]